MLHFFDTFPEVHISPRDYDNVPDSPGFVARTAVSSNLFANSMLFGGALTFCLISGQTHSSIDPNALTMCAILFSMAFQVIASVYDCRSDLHVTHGSQFRFLLLQISPPLFSNQSFFIRRLSNARLTTPRMSFATNSTPPCEITQACSTKVFQCGFFFLGQFASVIMVRWMVDGVCVST